MQAVCAPTDRLQAEHPTPPPKPPAEWRWRLPLQEGEAGWGRVCPEERGLRAVLTWPDCCVSVGESGCLSVAIPRTCNPPTCVCAWDATRRPFPPPGTASYLRGHTAPLGHPPPTPQAHTDSLNTLVALHQLYQYTQKYYDEVRGVLPGVGAGTQAAPFPGVWSDAAHLQIINALEEDPAAQKMQLAFRLQQIAAALENKVTDL